MNATARALTFVAALATTARADDAKPGDFVVPEEISVENPQPKPTPKPKRAGSLLSLAGVAGIYAPFVTWEYYTWYNGAHHVPLYFDTSWHDEKLGLQTYAGSADKVGHMYIHYVLTRGTTELLASGGWNKW